MVLLNRNLDNLSKRSQSPKMYREYLDIFFKISPIPSQKYFYFIKVESYAKIITLQRVKKKKLPRTF